MTKYTGPTQDTEDDRVFNKQFLFIKINCLSCSFSCYRALWIITQDGQGMDCGPVHIFGGEEDAGGSPGCQSSFQDERQG